ncbi:MAG: tyrosine-type recombinase/integrase [Candidatus Nanopelagicales bacterium]
MTEGRRTRKANRAAFGSVRKLPSGRFQARYADEAGRPMNAPHTFDTKAAALAHLSEVHADRTRGTYIDHRGGARPFGPYARAWIDNGGTRGRLAPRTAELYRDLLAGPLARFDAMPLNSITPTTVRDWYAATRRRLATARPRRQDRGGHPARAWALEQGMTVKPTGRLSPDVLAAWRAAGEPRPARAVPARSSSPSRAGEARLRQAYSLLRTILGTAVADRLVATNPCRIVGAGTDRIPERPYLAPDQLAAIVGAMPEEYHLPIQVMLGAHLRLGELVALERGDFDPARDVLRVERQTIHVGNREVTTGTKTGTAADVVLPPSIAASVVAHLASSTGFPRSPLFARADGTAYTRQQFQRAWAKAARSVGLGVYHLHDVRHAGLTFAAHAGATTRELMARARHRTSRAAMIYQHVAEERMALLAGRLDGVLGGSIPGAYGTPLAQQAPDAVATGEPIRGELTR